MRCRPPLVNFGHPVVALIERVVRVATAWPMAKRHCRRHTTLAGMNVASVFGGQQAEVKDINLNLSLLHDFARHLQQSKRLGHFARTSPVIPSRAANQQDP